jgi:hypothetical protein
LKEGIRIEMERHQRIVIYGKTLIMGTIGRSLKRLSSCEVIYLAASEQTEMEKIAPDIIFFDLETDHPATAFSMLDSRPDLLLIGVSPDRNIVIVWSGQRIREISIQSLLEMINEQLKNSSDYLLNEEVKIQQ